MATKKKAKPIGRPTKYSDKMLCKAIEYIEGGYTETGRGEIIPLVCGLALHLKVAKSTIYKWIESGNNPIFSDALSQLKDFQKLKLINNSLSGEYNPQIAKLLLSFNHGVNESQNNDSDEAAPPLTINFNVKEAVSEIKTTNAKP